MGRNKMSFSKSEQLAKVKGKKKPKNERKSLIKKLDDEIRRIVRKRDTRCCSCGKRLEDNLQVSHFVGRRHYSLRWDLRNVAGSCPGCNLLHNHDPNPYAKFMVDKYGKEILTKFEEVKNSYNKTTTVELRELLLKLKEL
jgi:5-methylcytosine-specific restriction endonuclease McrA